MKIFKLYLLIYLFIIGCDGEVKESSNNMSGNGINKEIAKAFAPSRNSNKVVGDEIWLATGEVAYIKLGIIKPDEKYIIYRSDIKNRKKMLEGKDGFVVGIDRNYGLVCMESECAEIFFLCKSHESQEECKYFR